MSTEFTSKRPPFTPEQQAVIHANTIGAVTSGLAARYSQMLQELVRQNRVIADNDLEDSYIRNMYGMITEWTSDSYTAEHPFAFRLKPSNMSEAVIMEKVRSDTGAAYPYSDVQIGLVGGLAEEGHAVLPFSQEDLAFALQALESQESVGYFIVPVSEV